MARLASLSFELQSVTAGIEFDASNGTGTKSISTGVFRGGAASLRVNPTSDYWFLGHQYRSNASTGKVYARLCFYIGTLPTGSVSIFAFAASTSGGNSGGQLQLNADGTLQLGYYNGSWNTVGSPSSALIPGVFYRIELSYDDSDINNTITARLEGVQFASGNGNDLGGNGCIQVGSLFDSETFDFNFDDIAVNDESGSFQNSWPGNGKMVLLHPSASGDSNTFGTQTGGTAGSGNNFTRVNETIIDDATTFNGSSTLNQEDLFNVTDLDINPLDSIALVSVGARFRNDTADTTAALKLEIEKTSGGTITQSSAIVPNSTSWKTNSITAPNTYPLTLYQDPDSATWTISTVNSMQIGYKLTTAPAVGGRRIDVSNVWALVEHVPAKVESIVETFNDNSTDTATWNTYEASGGDVAETSGQLQETLGAATNGSWAGYHSKYQFDLTGSSIFVQIVSATTGNTWLDLNLSNEPIPVVDNFLAIGVNVGTQRLEVIEEIEGADETLTDTAYDPNVHKWMRIRESGGTVYWEWSTDCITWTTLHSKVSRVPMSNIYIVLDDYEYDNLSTPNTHILDNLNNQISGTTKSNSVKFNIAGGASDNAVILNGISQYAEIVPYATLGSLTSFTIEGWFYQSSSTTLNYVTAITLENTSSGTYFSYIATEAGTPSTGVNFAANYTGTNADGYATSNVFNLDTWVHIALVHTAGEKTKLFKNGVEITYDLQQTPTGTQESASGMTYHIGYTGSSGGKYWKGAIACQRVWNRPLTGSEILANINYYLDPSKESGLISNLNFTEVSGSTVANSAVATSPASLIGSPSWTAGPSLSAKTYATGTGSTITNSVKFSIKQFHGRKSFEYRVYDKTGTTFIKAWTTEVTSEPRFRMVMNGGPGEMIVRLARQFDNFGEEVDVKLFNSVKVFVYDRDAPNGVLLYSGYISGYRPVLEGKKEFVEVTLLHYVTELSNYILRDETGATGIDQLSLDPSQILKNVISYYRLDGGFIRYTDTSIDNTSTVVSYSFSTYSTKEALDKIIELTPENWYWRIDADNIIYLKQSNLQSATHGFVIKKHIQSMETWRRGEDIVNRVYFIGADSGDPPVALYRVYSNEGSISSYGVRATKFVDKRVDLTTTADTMAQRILNRKKDPEIRTTITILDNNGPDSKKGYDIESIKPGHTMKIKGLKQGIKTVSYWDQMTWDVDVWDQTISFSSVDIIQIQSVEYTPGMVRIEASSRLPEISKRIEDVYRNQEQIATLTAPDDPTIVS